MNIPPKVLVGRVTRLASSAASAPPAGSLKMASSSLHADVHEVPMDVIVRPIPPVLDEDKVLSLMDTISDPSKRNQLVPPIDIMWIRGREGGHYYYSFGGCHRYEAHKRLGLATIKGNLIKATTKDLFCYLGASTPDLK